MTLSSPASMTSHTRAVRSAGVSDPTHETPCMFLTAVAEAGVPTTTNDPPAINPQARAPMSCIVEYTAASVASSPSVTTTNCNADRGDAGPTRPQRTSRDEPPLSPEDNTTACVSSLNRTNVSRSPSTSSRRRSKNTPSFFATARTTLSAATLSETTPNRAAANGVPVSRSSPYSTLARLTEHIETRTNVAKKRGAPRPAATFIVAAVVQCCVL